MIKYLIILILLTSCHSDSPLNSCLEVARTYQSQHGGDIIIVRYDKYNEQHAINFVNNTLHDEGFNITVPCKKQDIIKTTPLYWGAYQHNLKDR